MATRQKSWTDYPSQFVTLINIIATASLPALCGPYSLSQANTFRRTFYHFREALRGSLDSRGDGSHPARLYEMLEVLSVTIEPTSYPSLHNVIFDLHPMVKEANKLDPAGAQVMELSRAQFAAAQRPRPISDPIFSDEEMKDRVQEINND